ncbi:MAG: SUMF1/EgtB/PvdO family nonheme iron enzyme [Phycisphaerae bacterium]|nr:SUMF1/EgtB/PvdO family nonheme iron enzyme [Phycisphaerae bacterium]
MRGPKLRLLLALAAVMLTNAAANAEHPIPEAQRWATITHPANPFYPPPLGSQYPYPPGRVDYEYQISRTETTASEWLEFVRACAPYVSASEAESTVFTSTSIVLNQVSPGVFEYQLRLPELAERPVTMGWRFAARYCNWLHNNRGSAREAFEHGVYETSTFGGTSQSGFTDQRVRSPGATYFIPTIDEWVKAVYWDSEQSHPEIGEQGYWLYPDSSNTPLIAGPPGVGQTSAGGWTAFALPVASYPDVQSPWGLWDASGGAREWLETAVIDSSDRMFSRYVKGSFTGSGNLSVNDHIDQLLASSPIVTTGLRIARIVPTPSAALVFGLFGIAGAGCRSRRQML